MGIGLGLGDQDISGRSLAILDIPEILIFFVNNLSFLSVGCW